MAECSKATQALAQLSGIIQIMGSSLDKAGEHTDGDVEAAVADIEAIKIETRAMRLRADEHTLESLSRARSNFEEFQRRIQREFDTLKERAAQDFVETQEMAVRSVQTARTRQEEILEDSLDRLATKLRRFGTGKTDGDLRLFTLLKTSCEAMDVACKAAQSGWLRAETQLLGSNVWAVAWPEAARGAERRVRSAGGGGMTGPPDYDAARGGEGHDRSAVAN
ncbi:hypothetical protein CF319_g6095 [Tilletia indica]|uniref:Uncharacterized protein n=1 Tax=Tilletia indica TaxID=43049 RepID=A0A177TIZ4_9BASI|nr:hypothetical protein CF319_g6095 [Tilletia indica]KAE8228478.1 hypothetical protein CF326_g6585 [Tilletia indica]KAE8240592.1 hypothetical protein A4X13_0g7710 [Tilletia indica]